MASKKISKCPFCASDGVVKNVRSVAYYVVCKSCHATGGIQETKQGAIDLWNKRDGVVNAR